MRTSTAKFPDLLLPSSFCRRGRHAAVAATRAFLYLVTRQCAFSCTGRVTRPKTSRLSSKLKRKKKLKSSELSMTVLKRIKRRGLDLRARFDVQLE